MTRLTFLKKIKDTKNIQYQTLRQPPTLTHHMMERIGTPKYYKQHGQHQGIDQQIQ